MVTRRLIFAAWLLSPTLSYAQTQVLLINQTLVDNQFIFGAHPQTTGQIVIPSDDKGVIGISWQLSKITANSGVTGRYVTNANYGTTGVKHPFCSNITVDCGYPPPTYNYSDRTLTSVANGVDLYGDAALIESCRIINCRGTAARVTQLNASDSTSSSVLHIRDNDIANCFTGLEAPTADIRFSRNGVKAFRDYGMRVLPGSGTVTSTDHHIYGGAPDDDSTTQPEGICCYVEASSFRSTHDEWADAPYGYYSETGGFNATITSALIQHCWDRSIVCKAKTIFQNCYVSVPTSSTQHTDCGGIEFATSYCEFHGGRVPVNWYAWHDNSQVSGQHAADFAFRINDNCHECEIDTTIEANNLTDSELYPGSPYANQIGIKVAGATNGTKIHVHVFGFVTTGSCAVDFDSSAFKNCDVLIIGDDPDGAPKQNFLDLPDGNVAYNVTNSVVIHDRTNNKQITVSRGISGATNTNPIVITSNGHGLATGDVVYIDDVAGNTAANTTTSGVAVGNVTANTFELTGVAGNGTYAANTGWWGRVR